MSDSLTSFGQPSAAGCAQFAKGDLGEMGSLKFPQGTIGVHMSPCFFPQQNQHRIATQMWIQQPHCIDLSSVFTSIHPLRNGFTAYLALTPEYRAFMPPSPRGN